MMVNISTFDIILIFLFLFLAAQFKAFMDYFAHNPNTKEEWVSKWDIVNDKLVPLQKSPKYYLGLHTPIFKEKFPYSSTILVFITDGWHFFQFLFLRSIYIALSITLTDSFWKLMLMSFIIFPAFFSFWFTITYSEMKKNTK